MASHPDPTAPGTQPGQPPLLAPQPIRRPSIVERISDAAFGAGGAGGLKRALTGASYSTLAEGTGPAGAVEEIAYSKVPADYEVGPAIGFGSSAIVYIARYLGPGTTAMAPTAAPSSGPSPAPGDRLVAIKLIDLDMFERNQIDELRREIQIMSLSKHPNLLPTLASFVSASKLFIVTPFLSAGSCLDLMKYKYPMGMEEVAIATILKQALQGLDYLHRNGLIHRDVKAGNLLMDGSTGLVQLADFGVSSSLSDAGERRGVRKTFVGTPCWMSPEVMEQSGYDYKADIWSFGITAIELATGHAPYAKFPPLKVLMLTLQNDPPTLETNTYHKFSRAFKDMVDSCLSKDPTKRPSAEKLLAHSFFKQAKKPAYLQTTLLKDVPPLTERANSGSKKLLVPEQHRSSGVSWDFDPSSTPPPSLLGISPLAPAHRLAEGRSMEAGSGEMREGTAPTEDRRSRVLFADDDPAIIPAGLRTDSVTRAGGALAQPPALPPKPLDLGAESAGAMPTSTPQTTPTGALGALGAKKSRFQVDAGGASGSSSSVVSPLLAGQGAELGAHATPAAGAGVMPAGEAGVLSPVTTSTLQRKGRFTVNDRTTSETFDASPGGAEAALARDSPVTNLPSSASQAHMPVTPSPLAQQPSTVAAGTVAPSLPRPASSTRVAEGRFPPPPAAATAPAPTIPANALAVDVPGPRRTGRFAVQTLSDVPVAASIPTASSSVDKEEVSSAIIAALQAQVRALQERVRELEELQARGK